MAEAQTMALHDPLTGLANRNYFTDTLRDALGRSKRRGAMVAVLFLDFRQVQSRE